MGLAWSYSSTYHNFKQTLTPPLIKNNQFTPHDQLLQACLSNNIKQLSQLIKKHDITNVQSLLFNLEPNYFESLYRIPIDSSLKSLLHIASISGSIELIDYVINDLGFKNTIDITDWQGFTPLMLSTCCGNYIIMKHLITKYNANIQCQSYRLETFFQCVLLSNNIDIIQYCKQCHNDIIIQPDPKFIGYLYERGLYHSISFLVTEFTKQCLKGVRHSFMVTIASCSVQLLDFLIQNDTVFASTFEHFGFKYDAVLATIKSSQWDTTKHILTHYQQDESFNRHDYLQCLREVIQNKNATIEMCDFFMGLMNNYLNQSDLTQITISTLHNNNYHLFEHFMIKYNAIINDWTIVISSWRNSSQCTIKDVEMFHKYCTLLPRRINASVTSSMFTSTLKFCTLDVIKSLFDFPNHTNSASSPPTHLNVILEYCSLNPNPDVIDFFLQQYATNYTQQQYNELFKYAITNTIPESNHLVVKLLIEKYKVDPKVVFINQILLCLLLLPPSGKPINKTLFYYCINTNIINIETKITQHGINYPSLLYYILGTTSTYNTFSFDDIQWLIETKGARIDLHGEANQNLLRVIMNRPNPDPLLLQYFLNLGINPNHQDYSLYTPINYLFLRNEPELLTNQLQYLLDRKLINFQLRNKTGQTLFLQLASKMNAYIPHIKLILQYYGDDKDIIDTKNNDGYSALYYALYYQNYELTLLLLQYHCDVFDITNILKRSISIIIQNRFSIYTDARIALLLETAIESALVQM